MPSLPDGTGNHESGDWRLMGQERYLRGAALELRDYEPSSESWEHDHCEFCQRTLSAAGSGVADALTRGYTTTAAHERGAGYYWVCEECFADFAERFWWKAVGGHKT